jgi:Flp pilus assembly protein TadG
MTRTYLAGKRHRFQIGARFIRDTEGVAAIEFAFIGLLMVAMLFGVFSVSSGVAIDRKVSTVAQTLSDLISRSETATDLDISSAVTIGKAILNPYTATPLKMTVTSVWIDSNGKGRVQWSDGDSKRTTASEVAVPAALVTRDVNNKVIADQYLIYSEVSYVYTPIVNWTFSSSFRFTFAETSFARPRLSTCVQRSPLTKTDACLTLGS